MARRRFASGTYRLEVPTVSASTETPVRIDTVLFTVLKGTTTDVNVNDYMSYDDSEGSLTVNRIPSNPVSVTQSVGGESRFNPSGNMNTKTVRSR